MESTKKCPYCAETIQWAARVCRFCNRDLTVTVPPVMPVVEASKKPAEKKHVHPLVAFLVVVGAWYFVFGGASCVNGQNAATESGNTASTNNSFLAPATRQVTYKVSGSTSAASVTYNDPQGGTAQSEVGVPWQKTMPFKDGDFVYISAQNKQDSGSITTQIVVDGVPWKKTSSNGAYMIASCNGSVARP